MRSFRHRLRETLGLSISDIEEEATGDGGAVGGDAGSTGTTNGTDTGTTEPTEPTNDEPQHRPFGLGAYWKSPIGKCPKGTTRQPDGTCKKK